MKIDLNSELLEQNRNVVNLNSYRKHVKLDKSLDDYREYLTLLDSSEITVESRYLVEQIKNNCLDVELIKRSEILLDEISNRIKSSTFKSAELQEMSSSLRTKINDLI